MTITQYSKMMTVILLMICSFSTFAEENKLTSVQIEEMYASSYKYEALGKYSDAIIALSEIEKKHKSSYTVNYRIGWLYYLNGKYANAVKSFKQAQQIVPTSIEIMNMFCLLYNAREDWSSLELEAARIIKNDHYNLNANYWYVVALMNQKKYKIAEIACLKILSVYPINTTFLGLQGEINYGMDKLDNAYSFFTNLKILDPNNGTAKYYLDLMDKAEK